MRLLIAIVFLICACVSGDASPTPDKRFCTAEDQQAGICQGDDGVPVVSCAELGCPVAPSGNPNTWIPCTTVVCYCRAADSDTVMTACVP